MFNMVYVRKDWTKEGSVKKLMEGGKKLMKNVQVSSTCAIDRYYPVTVNNKKEKKFARNFFSQILHLVLNLL